MTNKTKGRLTPEMFNMLCAVSFLIAVILIAVTAHTISSHTNKNKGGADLLFSPLPPSTLSCRVENPLQGPFHLCNRNHPWSDIEVDQIAASLIPLNSFSSVTEEPYFTGASGLQAQPEAVMALHTLSVALQTECPAVTPLITEAYQTYAAAGTNSGFTALHTGYAFSVLLRVGLDHPIDLPLASISPDSKAGPAARWLHNNLPYYGFIVLRDEIDEGRWLYVGAPHALAMQQHAMTPSAYLSFLRGFSIEAPLSIKDGMYTRRIFYVPADHGVATITLPPTTSYAVCGNGYDGFLFVLNDT